MKHINDGMLVEHINVHMRQLTECILGIPEGENCHKAAQHTAEISARWKGMTKEEREAATEGAMIELAEQCENKALASHNVPLNSFQDVNKTLQSIDNQVCFFHSCIFKVILTYVARGIACAYWNRDPSYCSLRKCRPLQSTSRLSDCPNHRFL